MSIYTDASFAAPSARSRRFSRIVAERVEAAAPRVLDLGCGSGELLVALARALPAAELVGVDLSRPNVVAARRAAEAAGVADRVRLVEADVMIFEDRPFDLIVSWGTLHLIPTDALTQFRRIANLLVEGGHFVNAMPFRGGYNTLLHAVRTMFRALRCGPVDRLVLGVARLIAGASYDPAFYHERLVYMYVTPRFYSSPSLDLRIERATGLRAVERLPEEHASIAQMKHRITVYHKTGGA